MLVSATALAVPAVIIGGSAAVAVPRHTVTPGKSCGPGNPPATTTDVGQPYVCSYSIQDTDGFHDGMTVSDIDDVVESAGGAVDSGNILGSLQLIFDPGVANPSAMASCTGGSGLGTTASPYVGATLCTIPWDAGIETENYSFYTVAPDDYNLPSHELTDTVTFTWDSLCSAPGGSGISCPPPNQSATIGGSTIVQQLPSDTSTQVLNSSGTAVTTVAVGTTVHDSVTVSPDASAPAGSPTPTGSVTIDWFSNSACSGSPTAASSPLALNGSGQVDATGFSFTPGTAGKYAFQATYNGDPSNPAYVGSTGPCEPLTVVDADIIIAPPTATNPVGATHTLTVTVDENPGTGSVAAPDGTMPTLSLSNTGGATATITGGTCATTGTVSGSCTFTISSPTTGLTQATASVTVIVGGVTLTRTTDGPDSSGDSAPADKTWVQANSSVVTTIQQGGQTVTSVSADSSVTDQATVSGVAGGAAPTGTVTFTFFTNGTCTGTGMGAGTTSLTGGTATSDAEGPLAGGSDSFQATYNGDANYLTSTGKCEPLTVVTPVLTIKKTADATPVSTGTTIGFSITVGNSSTTATATSVTLNDPLPAGTGIDWTISPAYSGPGTCSIAGAVGSQVLGCSFGDMAPGASASVHISSATTGGSAGTYKNTATASATNASSVTASATIVVQAPGLSIKKTADATPVSVGTAIGFTVTVANSSAAGTGTATGVTLNDPLPAGTGIDWSISPAYSGPGTCSITGAVGSQVLGCSFGNLAPGGSASVHISSATTAGSAGTYLNTATASATNAPSVMASATIVVEAPDLSITKTADATPVSVGTTIGFTVTVANSSTAGTGTATSVTLNDPLPAGPGIDWSISPAYAGPGTCSITGAVGSQVLGCNFGNLAPGASASVHVSSATTLASAGTYKNTGTASASNAPSIMASATIVVEAPGLSIKKTADATPVSVGTAIGFTVTVANSSAAGTATATGVTLNDPLPAGPGIDWSISPAYSGPGTCSITGAVGSQVLGCSFGDMAPGASASVHISSATTVASAGTYKNTATASATNAPSIMASATIVVTAIPSTSLTETASAKVIANGTAVTFTYQEKNTGSIGISGVTVTGSLCGPATFVSSSDPSKTILDPGATWTFTCTITLTNSTTKIMKFVDKATATGTSVVSGDPAPTEKAKATVKVKPGPPPCGISVSISPNPVVETGDSDVRAIVQVEACASYAGDLVNIDSQQLTNSCTSVAFGTLQPGVHPLANSIQVVLDDDGNATVTLTGTDCTPGPSLVEADLVNAPYLTATTTLTVLPPNVTPSGVVGYPANEVETGDTTASGFSDVYAVFYVETDPVYAETTAEISSAQLAGRCLGGVTWTSNQGTSTGSTATATIDNDGNAVFTLTGASCAPGTSTVIADILAGAHTTYSSNYTVDPPTVTPS
jgi:uncharacterized repeat protein (TIGR01451 family)